MIGEGDLVPSQGSCPHLFPLSHVTPTLSAPGTLLSGAGLDPAGLLREHVAPILRVGSPELQAAVPWTQHSCLCWDMPAGRCGLPAWPAPPPGQGAPPPPQGRHLGHLSQPGDSLSPSSSSLLMLGLPSPTAQGVPSPPRLTLQPQALWWLHGPCLLFPLQSPELVSSMQPTPHTAPLAHLHAH